MKTHPMITDEPVKFRSIIRHYFHMLQLRDVYIKQKRNVMLNIFFGRWIQADIDAVNGEIAFLQDKIRKSPVLLKILRDALS